VTSPGGSHPQMIKSLFLKKDARICNKIDISEISFEIASATALGYLERKGISLYLTGISLIFKGYVKTFFNVALPHDPHSFLLHSNGTSTRAMTGGFTPSPLILPSYPPRKFTSFYRLPCFVPLPKMRLWQRH